MIDIKSALLYGVQLLTHESKARMDAEILLAFVLKTSRTFLHAHADDVLLDDDWERYQTLLNKRLQGSPIAYLTGVREFWSLPLTVSKATLIPRHETELLVELSLQFLAAQEESRILDLGTGTGAIALALASENPLWQIDAVDISIDAINIAKQNAEHHHLRNVKFYVSNWFSDLPKHKYNIIISNPPYIAVDDPHLKCGDLRFEPINALISGRDGLDDLRHLIGQSPDYLSPEGILLVEHGYDQKVNVQSLFHQAGYHSIQTWKDLQGNDRATCGRVK